MKLLYEQVDSLYYCGPGTNCDGGSPLKRIGPTIDHGDVTPNGDGDKWHTYRVEVRSNGATLYIDDSYKGYFSDTTWINEPYFGVFASTEEYQPSIWFYDYYQITPLDN